MSEPDSDMRIDEQPDWLETLLKGDRQARIDDAGFSARVMQRIAEQRLAARAESALAGAAESDRRLRRFSAAGALAGMLFAACTMDWRSVVDSIVLAGGHGILIYGLVMLTAVTVVRSLQADD